MKKNLLIMLAAVIVLASAITMAVIIVPKMVNKTNVSSTQSVSEVISSNTEYRLSDTDLTDAEIPSEISSTNILASSLTNETQSISQNNKQNSLSSASSNNTSSEKNNVSTSSALQNNNVNVINTNYNTTIAVSSATSYVSSATNNDDPYYEPINIPEVVNEERFDSDGKLIIDTDTLNGKKAIAITFDDGPSIYTEELLNGLRERDARATFFMVGSCVERFPHLLQVMVNDGHQIGNHTYNHPSINLLAESTWRNEIAVTDEIIYNACGQYATAFRPPYGSYTQYQARTIDKTVTIWSVDTLDWQSRNKQSVKNIILSKVKDGSIVLLHDLYKTSVDAVLEAIDELKQEGYIFVTVDELLTRYGYPISNTAHFSQYPVNLTVFEEKETTETDLDTENTMNTDTELDTKTSSETDTDTAIDTNTDQETDTDVIMITDTDEATDNDMVETDSLSEINTDNE